MTTVEVQDCADWTITYAKCVEWIEQFRPDYRRAYLGHGSSEDDWDWDSMFHRNYIEFVFRDPSFAMLFKLTWGGA